MATKQFNRTVEAINELLDKLDGLPTFPLVYRGEVLEYTDLPEEPVQGDCYLVSFETGTDHVSNKLYYYSGTVWKEIAVDGYTKYEIDQMFDSIGGGLHWKGAVSYYNNLPSGAELGDMWTVLYEGTSGSEACGDEYAWGTLNGTEQWILIGKETYSKTQIDAMVDGLTDRIAIDENNILWNYTETSYAPNNANVYEYTGISFTVPANEVYEFYAADRNDSSVNDIFSAGIIVADNSSNVTLKASTIAENSGTPTQAPNFWLRTVSGITPKRNQNTTYYVWASRVSTSTSGRIILAYRKMVII